MHNMKSIRWVSIAAGCAVLFLLVPGCGTLQSVGNVANGLVNTAANTAVKALSPSTYTGDSKETYNSREPLKKRRNTMSSSDGTTAKSRKTKSSHSVSDNPPIGMPYRSRYYNEHSAR